MTNATQNGENKMTTKNGYVFRDTFNDTIISRHTKESSAVRAAINWGKSFRRNHSPNSYLPTELIRIRDGEELARIEYQEEANFQGYVCFECDL